MSVTRLSWVLVVLVAAGCGRTAPSETGAEDAGESAGLLVPHYEVDPSWLKLPANWAVGQIADVHVDTQDHVWILHRPRTAKPAADQIPAPSVWEVEPSGNVVQSWGGPGDNGYEWPDIEHGLFATHDGHIWIAGNHDRDHHMLKFTRDGEFVMQIGRRGQSTGNADTTNVNRAASVWVHARTNELFVGDGYGNRRVVVFDQTTGEFKRMWGAFGNTPEARKPDEPVFSPDDTQGDGPPQFNNPHSVKVSDDDLVYVADRDNQRVQVFTLDGRYLQQVFVSRGRMPASTYTGTSFGRPRNQIADELLKDPASATRLAFSHDPEQRFLYVGDRRTHVIHILDRGTLEIVGRLADGPGEEPGQLYIIHGVATDSQGNVYTAETMPNLESQGGLVGRPGASGTDDPTRGNRRAQKFVLTGHAPAAIGTR